MQDYRRPRCGDYSEHDEHIMRDLTCPGYSAEEFAVAKMCEIVRVFACSYTDEDIPAGAEIRMCPYTFHALLRNLVQSFSESSLVPLEKLYGLPVTVVPGMPLGSWLLIAASGEVPD